MGDAAYQRREPAPDARPEPRADAPRIAAVEAAPPQPAATAPKRKRGRRIVLLLLGPLVVVALSLWSYLAGGRYASTDNAYVKADVTNIATDVAGVVAAVQVKEGQRVKRGDPLYRLDEDLFRITLQGAEAQRDVVRNQLNAIHANYNQALAQIQQAEVDLNFFQRNISRQSDLASQSIASQAALDQARRDWLAAQARVRAGKAQAEALLAQIGGRADEPVEQNAQYRQAQAAVERAARDLRRTDVRAPVDGVVTNVAHIQPGSYLAAAQTAFNLVALQDTWVEANLKETDLLGVKTGDRATITVDAYPGRVWNARVASIAPATGAEFSVLPAQNASGNWVKVVQRLTVRLSIERQPDAPELRAGMSVYASIDTGRTRSLQTLPRDLRHLLGL
jgi:membrane fusion protein (multidrug efflux system)